MRTIPDNDVYVLTPAEIEQDRKKFAADAYCKKHDMMYAHERRDQQRNDPTGIGGVAAGFALCLLLCSPLFILVIFV